MIREPVMTFIYYRHTPEQQHIALVVQGKGRKAANWEWTTVCEVGYLNKNVAQVAIGGMVVVVVVGSNKGRSVCKNSQVMGEIWSGSIEKQFK